MRYSRIGGLVLFVGALQAAGQIVPAAVNYQGRLTDVNGQAITGTRDLSFSVFGSSSGGTAIWGPKKFSAVPLVNGYFNVVLGPNDDASPARSILSAFGANASFLEVTILSGATPQVIQPRQQILTSPYAAMAGNGVPKGTIVAWYPGAVAYDSAVPPYGWAICDGNNGTPDLRSKFLVGSAKGGTVGVATGTATHTHGAVTLPGGPPGSDWEHPKSSWNGWPPPVYSGTYDIAIPQASNIPPSVSVVYIMKL